MIPENYRAMHSRLGTWERAEWRALLEDTLTDEATRSRYE